MPVLSPHRSSASALAGSYRSTFSSSALDRPYFTSPSYSPRITSYSERYSSRSYTDADGKRVFSRSGSVTEDGVTTRYREETRESSIRRDSGFRENSISDYPRRESSLSRDSSSRLSAVNVLDSVAELRNKYSPANYVPACLREKNENIARSKSINDIGLPPIESSVKQLHKKKVTNNDSLKIYSNSVLLNSNTNTNNDNMPVADDNGNRASVADLRKKFVNDKPYNNLRCPLKTQPPKIDIVEGGGGVKISENLFKKQDSLADSTVGVQIKKDKVATANFGKNNLDVGLKNGIRDEGKIEEDGRRSTSRVNNFASYIPSKNCYEKGEELNGGFEVEEDNNIGEQVGEDGGKRLINDISPTSPKLNNSSSSSTRSAISPSSTSILNSTANSTNSLSRRSSDRDRGYNDDGAAYDKYGATSPVKTLGLNGLKNIGNTCFMNSVIQCLSNTKLLLEYLLKDWYVSDINTTTSGMKGALIKAFAEVIKELWSEDSADRVINTTSLKSQIQRFAPRFIGYAQQDAQEFLRYLLEGLHEDVNRVVEKPKPILTEIDEKLSDIQKSAESWSRYLRMDNSRIVDYFVGQLKSTLKCTHCGHCSVTFDPFWDLSLPIPQRAGQVRLAQCLESFTREETLDGDEKPTCSKCKERRKCTKSFTIQKFPKILVIHLKRFSLAERFRGKLSVTVDFPLEGLDMSHYAADNVTPCRYNLYAISNHSGTTYSGHYTAYCRHPYSKSWHEYNDSRVSPISSKSIVSGEAYVLFYEQEGQKAHL